MANIEKSNIYPVQSQVYNNPYKAGETKRFYRNIGHGIKVPETAISRNYVDKKCPFTGEIRIKNKFFKAEVIKMKQVGTILVQKKKLHYVSKYKRYERRNKNFSVHLSPCFLGMVNVGDVVTVCETRPLSKTVHNVVVSVENRGGKSSIKKINSL